MALRDKENPLGLRIQPSEIDKRFKIAQGNEKQDLIFGNIEARIGALARYINREVEYSRELELALDKFQEAYFLIAAAVYKEN